MGFEIVSKPLIKVMAIQNDYEWKGFAALVTSFRLQQMLSNTGIVRLKVWSDSIKPAVSKFPRRISFSPILGSAKAYSQHDRKSAK